MLKKGRLLLDNKLKNYDGRNKLHSLIGEVKQSEHEKIGRILNPRVDF